MCLPCSCACSTTCPPLPAAAPAPQSRKAYDDALRMGAIMENVPDEFVPGEQAMVHLWVRSWMVVFESNLG
jgi:hypothetical protein